MEQRTSELESNCFLPNFKISSFVDVLNNMSKTPALDSELSQVLDDFLAKLAECDAYIEQGICNMNFAEAALLLQRSADVYNKKVELLWEVIFDCQKRLIQSDEQNGEHSVELERLEERKRKYKRKRRTNADETQTVKLIDDFSFGRAESIDYLNQNYEPADLSTEWTKFRVTFPEDTVNETACGSKVFFPPTNNIYNEDNEYVGRYDQFHSFTLLGDILQLENMDCSKSELNQSTRSCTLFGDILQKELTSVNSNTPTQHQTLEQLYRKKSFVSLERLPVNLLREQLRRYSMADSLFDDDCISLESNHCASPIQNELSDKNRSKSCSQDSAFYDDEHMDSIDVSMTEESVNLGSSIQVDKTTSKTNVSTSVTKENSQIEPSLCLGGSSIVIPKTRNVTSLETVKDKKENMKKIKVDKKAKLPGKRMLKLATGVTVNHHDFEKFFRLQYKPGDGEGTAESYSSESEESESSDDDFDNTQNEVNEERNEDDDGREESANEFSVASRVDEISRTASQVEACRVESQFDSSSRTERQSESALSSQQDEQSRMCVQEWRNFITPKLKGLQNKSDFDIHEYGARIIEPSQIGEERHFKEIVKEQTAAEVARYFIATLQLANTYNIEIAGAVPGELANETFRIKTIDKTKHHEMLEEYQAPSEESFRERLELVKTRNPELQLHSTPRQSPPKKIKFSKVLSRRFFDDL